MNEQVIQNKKKISKTSPDYIIDFEKYPKKIGQTEIKKFTDNELYDYCRFTGINAKIWSRRFIAALPEVEKRQLYRKHDFYSIYEFASKVGGISNNTVNVVLWLHEILKDRPGLRELIGEVGLHKIRTVVKIVTKENEKFWIQKVKEMSKSALEVLVREIKQDKMAEIFEKNNNKDNQQNNTIVSQIYPGINLTEIQKDGLLSQGKLLDNEGKNECTFKQINSSDCDFNNFLMTKLKRPERINFSVPIDLDTEFQLRKFKLNLEKARKGPVDWNSTLKELVRKSTNC